MAVRKPVTITVVTTETYEVAGEREAYLLKDFIDSLGTVYPPEGSWGISDLPQVGDSQYEVEVNT